MVGDVATDNDAKRLSQSGVKCVPLMTGNVCHLDATKDRTRGRNGRARNPTF